MVKRIPIFVQLYYHYQHSLLCTSTGRCVSEAGVVVIAFQGCVL